MKMTFRDYFIWGCVRGFSAEFMILSFISYLMIIFITMGLGFGSRLKRMILVLAFYSLVLLIQNGATNRYNVF